MILIVMVVMTNYMNYRIVTYKDYVSDEGSNSVIAIMIIVIIITMIILLVTMMMMMMVMMVMMMMLRMIVIMMMITVMITVITVCVCIKTLSDSRRFPRLAGAPMRFCYFACEGSAPSCRSSVRI